MRPTHPGFTVPPAEGDLLQIDQIHARLRLDEARLRRLIRLVLEGERRALKYLSVILAGHDIVRSLNRDYRDGDYDTDVLSFPLGDPDAVDGEVYVNLDYAAEHHERFSATFDQEAHRYVVHGLLHLLGYDDRIEEGRKAMRLLEDHYLGLLTPSFEGSPQRDERPGSAA